MVLTAFSYREIVLHKPTAKPVCKKLWKRLSTCGVATIIGLFGRWKWEEPPAWLSTGGDQLSLMWLGNAIVLLFGWCPNCVRHTWKVACSSNALKIGTMPTQAKASIDTALTSPAAQVVYLPFMLSKVWLLFSLLVFLFSQSILKSWFQSEPWWNLGWKSEGLWTQLTWPWGPSLIGCKGVVWRASGCNRSLPSKEDSPFCTSLRMLL